MQEKLVVLWQFLEPRLRVVMILVFVALLGLILFLRSTESLDAWTPPGIATPQPTPRAAVTPGPGETPLAGATPALATPTPVPTPSLADALLKEDRTAANNVGNVMYAVPKSVEKTPYASLIVHSMFSIKQVLDQPGREQIIRDLYNEATRLRAERNLAASLAKCNEVLAMRPNHIEAQNLKQQLQQEMGGTVR